MKKKLNLDYIITQLGISTDRYIAAEELLLDIMQYPWYKKLFLTRKHIVGYFLRNMPK